jgi:hypothetical protein
LATLSFGCAQLRALALPVAPAIVARLANANTNPKNLARGKAIPEAIDLRAASVDQTRHGWTDVPPTKRVM